MSNETDRAVAVKCNHCEYMTADGDLETCPECGLADALMDMDAETVALQWNARRAAANAHDALVEACEAVLAAMPSGCRATLREIDHIGNRVWLLRQLVRAALALGDEVQP